MYRLKFNQSGSWRNVLDFDEKHLEEVILEAKRLARLAKTGLSYKIIEMDGKAEIRTVLDYNPNPRYRSAA